MKITFVSPAPNLSGGQRVVAIYADLLQERGHDVTVVARRHPSQTFGTKMRQLALGKRLATPIRETHFDRMEAHLHLPSHCGPIVADDVPDADVVIATWWETAFEIVHFPLSKGRKIYFVQHHEVHPHLPSHISGATYFLPLKKITIASWLVDKMRDLYGDEDVALVPNSVEHGLFFAPARERQSVPTVGMMYSPTHFKGVDIALRAIEIARRTHRNLRLVAFSTQPVAKNLPLPDGTELHLNPPQTILREIYASCDVFITASRSEGFGLPILEAMACRTPVIATHTGCAKDVIQEGRNGYVVDVEDAEALGERLTQLLSMDSNSWKAMSETARLGSLGYTWREAAALFEESLG